MKNLYSILTTILLSICLVAGFTACDSSDSDDDSGISASSLIGTWYEYSKDEGSVDLIITFNSGGTGIWQETGDYSGSQWDSFEYKLSGNMLIITYDYDEKEYFEIESLTSSKLILTDEYGDTFTLRKSGK